MTMMMSMAVATGTNREQMGSCDLSSGLPLAGEELDAIRISVCMRSGADYRRSGYGGTSWLESASLTALRDSVEEMLT